MPSLENKFIQRFCSTFFEQALFPSQFCLKKLVLGLERSIGQLDEMMQLILGIRIPQNKL